MPGNNPKGFAEAFRQSRSARLFPALEMIPELSRGDMRLAVEVAIAELRAQHVPTFAHERAFETLLAMAKG